LPAAVVSAPAAAVLSPSGATSVAAAASVAAPWAMVVSGAPPGFFVRFIFIYALISRRLMFSRNEMQ